MITGEVRNKVDAIWEIFWTGGITNPLSVIEQFTYLLFMKSLDELQNTNDRNAELLGSDPKQIFAEDEQQYRWSNFKHLDSEKMFELTTKEVFPFIKNLHGDESSSFSRYMKDAIFMIPTAQMLERLVTSIGALNLDGDVKGDLYEYLLSKVATSGTNGQFRTPRHIIQMMVELMKPTPEDVIIDPACGTSGFLVESSAYLKEKHTSLFADEKLAKHFNEAMFYGHDMDSTMLRIGAMNMMLHGVEKPNISYQDSLSSVNSDSEKFSLILANPPFKGSLDYDSVAPDLLKVTKTKKTELLFLALFLRILEVGGRCASIVPDGVLFGSSNAHKSIRKEIVDNQQLEGIISMPSGVFKPYAGVSTAIMIFTKTNAGGTGKVWFYDMTADGFSLDDKRQATEENDISDIVQRFSNLAKEVKRKRTDKSFLVPVEEIRENDYDLSINRYKEIVYDEVEYDHPRDIIIKIKELETAINDGLNKLTEMI